MTDAMMLIAQRLSALREIHGLSPEAVAAHTQTEVSVVSAYESGTQDIPVSYLLSFAQLTQVALTDLLTGESPKLHTYTVVRRGRGTKVERRAPYGYEHLAPNFINRKAEPFLVTAAPGTGDPGRNVHDSQEFNYVLEGRMRVYIGNHSVELDTGDALYFDARAPHAMLALGDSPCRFLSLLF